MGTSAATAAEVTAVTPTADSATRPAKGAKGADIRARVAENRAKRLAIAAAMKAEAGVTEHTINERDLGGLWFRNTTRIHSPEGRRIDHLVTVAHECGHNFLHGDGIGFYLPPHVIEYEAERYAELALRHHGMVMPQARKAWGRLYISSYFEKDRAAGWPIDPRVHEYVSGAYWQRHHDMMRRTPPGWNHPATGIPADELYAPAIVARARQIEAAVRQHAAREAAERAKAIATAEERNRTRQEEANTEEMANRLMARLRRAMPVALATILWVTHVRGDVDAVPGWLLVALYVWLTGCVALDAVDVWRGRAVRRFSLVEDFGGAVGWFSTTVRFLPHDLRMGAYADSVRRLWQGAKNIVALGAMGVAGLAWVRVSIPGPPTPEQSALFLALLLVAVASPVATTLIDRARDCRRWQRGLPPFDPLGADIFSRAVPSAAPRP